MPAKKAHTIYLISDGTCRTCEQVIKATLVQFETNVRVVRKAKVRRPTTVWNLVEQAARDQAMVFYTLVYDKAREAMLYASQQHLVPAVDLLGPVLVSLHDFFKSAMLAEPGILYKSDKQYYDRIDAVEYTIHHDDGVAIHELSDADVVLVGVSRASKSTTCFYLAYRGVRAANVPLFPGSAPPPELLKIDRRRVIGFTVNPRRLRAIREARLHSWGADIDDSYADRIEVVRELRAVSEMFTEHGWRIIDVSYKAIEEIASEVLQLLEEAGIKAGGHGERTNNR